MKNKSYYIKTFGCQMNIRDSEIMAQKLSENGYIESLNIEDASLVVLNTCSIRAKAEQKVFSLLGSLRKNKRNNPDMQICVAGCVAQQEGDKIIARMPHVDLIIGTQHIYNLPALLDRSRTGKTAINLSDDYEIPRYVPNLKPSGSVPVSPAPHTHFQFSRFVTIMQGCNNFCTYCVVPYTRGREVSRSVVDILDEVKVLIGTGVREITLLGQNVNSYGRSNPVTDNGSPYSFSMLLQEVSRINGLKRLRFTTSNPKDLSDDLISCFSEIPNLCPQFHLPVQSGSDAILKRMSRKYNVADYLQKVEKLVAACPDIALTTDVIVGFPGETDKDFQATMNLLEEVRFHGSFSFKYSDRPGTRATHLENKVDEKAKSVRLQVFQRRQDEISQERNREYIGMTVPILVEGASDNTITGRTSTNHIVHVATNTNGACAGDFIDVTIIYAGQHSLKADQSI